MMLPYLATIVRYFLCISIISSSLAMIWCIYHHCHETSEHFFFFRKIVSIYDFYVFRRRFVGFSMMGVCICKLEVSNTERFVTFNPLNWLPLNFLVTKISCIFFCVFTKIGGFYRTKIMFSTTKYIMICPKNAAQERSTAHCATVFGKTP